MDSPPAFTVANAFILQTQSGSTPALLLSLVLSLSLSPSCPLFPLPLCLGFSCLNFEAAQSQRSRGRVRERLEREPSVAYIPTHASPWPEPERAAALHHHHSFARLQSLRDAPSSLQLDDHTDAGPGRQLCFSDGEPGNVSLRGWRRRGEKRAQIVGL